MKLEDFDYNLPEQLIAQKPAAERTGSRLMVLNREEKTIRHRNFLDLIEYLRPDDLLVFNDTRVIPARLLGYKEETGGKVELLLIAQLGEGRWEAMVRPGRRIKKGHKLVFGDGALKAEVIGRTDEGTRIVEFEFEGEEMMDVLEKVGQTPLPPYIKEPIDDQQRYQTVFGRYNGSSAAPTASLHFDEKTFSKLEKAGVDWTFITLHIGPGTFQPVKTPKISDHKIHREYFKVSNDSLEKITQTRKKGGRVIPVGTTSVRTLETVFNNPGKPQKTSGWTDIFIYPGYQFKMTDALITNFHLPRSTLIMLVAAFVGIDFIKEAYKEAVRKKYRFYSFGDCMFIY